MLMRIQHGRGWKKMRLKKLHRKYARFTLSVHAKTINAATMGELGRFPLMIGILMSVLNNWTHLNSTVKDRNTLLELAYQENIKLEGGGSSNYVTFIKKILKLMGKAWPGHKDSPTNRQELGERLMRSYVKIWSKRLDGSAVSNVRGKLDRYLKIKHNFVMEEYLSTVRNADHRKAMARIRTGSHRLRIESGRYTIPKTDRNDRICSKNGYDHLDDVSHFFFDCLLIKPLQKTLASTIKQLCDNYERMSPEEKLYFILNSGGDICKTVAKFCCEALIVKEIP